MIKDCVYSQVHIAYIRRRKWHYETRDTS